MDFVKKLFSKEFYTRKVLIILAVSVLALAVCISLVVFYSCDNEQGGEDQTSKVESTTDNKETTDKPDETTGETPDETTGETPDETTGETPDETTGETPDETTGATPDETTGATPDETTGNVVKSYNITVVKGNEFGEILSLPKSNTVGGTLYEISVTAKKGYVVKNIKVNGIDYTPVDNKIECVLSGDASVAVEFGRKTNAVLEERRNTVVDKITQITTTQFKYDRDYDYKVSSTDLSITDEQIYQGMPYSSNPTLSFDAFLDFVTGKDSNGVYLVSDILAQEDYIWGSNCSDVVYWSWATISATIDCTISYKFTNRFGLVYVGEIDIQDSDFNNAGQYKRSALIATTKNICNRNGIQRMYEAYSLYAKGDGAICYSNMTGHAIMIGAVMVKRNADGTINGDTSYILYYDQNSGYKRKMGLKNGLVMSSCAYLEKMTFTKHFNDGYLPVTCKELMDESYPIHEVTVTDSVDKSNHNKENLLNGYIESNYYVSKLNMTITDSLGNTVYSANRYRDETTPKRMYISWFADSTTQSYKDKNLNSIYADKLEVDTLGNGKYRCKVMVYLANGNSYTVRDFEFTN